MMKKCIWCGIEFETRSKRRDTCSRDCAMHKMEAWINYLYIHKSEIQEKAIAELKEARGL